jgi:hypothetical protein
MGEGLTMSNYEYEDDDDDYTTPEANNDLVKQLRKANKQKEKELTDIKAQFETLNKAQRDRTVKDVLASRGVNGKIAKFIPSDIDPTEESVSKWLEENADVFGFQVEESPQTPNVDPKVASDFQRMTKVAEQGVTPSHSEDIHRRLMNATSREELDQVIRESGL